MKKIASKLFVVQNGNQIDIHARIVEDQGPRELTIISDIKKPEYCHSSVQKGHWSEFCKNPVTHLWVTRWPESKAEYEYQGLCTHHAHEVTWLPDRQHIIEL